MFRFLRVGCSLEKFSILAAVFSLNDKPELSYFRENSEKFDC